MLHADLETRLESILDEVYQFTLYVTECGYTLERYGSDIGDSVT